MAGAPAPSSRVRARPLTPRRLTDLAAAAILSCLAFVGLFPFLFAALARNFLAGIEGGLAADR